MSLLADAIHSRTPGFTRWLHCLQMAGTSGTAAEVAMELVKVREEIEETRGLLRSCGDASSRNEVLKLLTALAQSKTALLQKEARLAGAAAGEWGCNRAAGVVLRNTWQHARFACRSAAHGGEHDLMV